MLYAISVWWVSSSEHVVGRLSERSALLEGEYRISDLNEH